MRSEAFLHCAAHDKTVSRFGRNDEVLSLVEKQTDNDDSRFLPIRLRSGYGMTNKRQALQSMSKLTPWARGRSVP